MKYRKIIRNIHLKYNKSTTFRASNQSFKPLAATVHWASGGVGGDGRHTEKPFIRLDYQTVEQDGLNKSIVGCDYTFHVLRSDNVIPDKCDYVLSTEDGYGNLFHIYQEYK